MGAVKRHLLPSSYANLRQPSHEAKPKALSFIRRTITRFFDCIFQPLKNIPVFPTSARNIVHGPNPQISAVDACRKRAYIARPFACCVFILIPRVDAAAAFFATPTALGVVKARPNPCRPIIITIAIGHHIILCSLNGGGSRDARHQAASDLQGVWRGNPAN